MFFTCVADIITEKDRCAFLPFQSRRQGPQKGEKMSSTTVQSIGLQSTGMINTAQTQNSSQTSASDGTHFDDVMDAAKLSTQAVSQTGRQSTAVQVQSTTNQLEKTTESDNNNKSAVVQNSKDSQNTSDRVSRNKTTVNDQTDDRDVSTDVKDAISEAGNKLIKDTAKELGISEEDVKNAMETLGLTAADLLNPQNMIQLFSRLTQDPDSVNILTDSNLFQSLQNLLQETDTLRQNITENFSLSDEQLQAAIEAVSQQEQPEVLPDLTDFTVNDNSSQQEPENTQQTIPEESQFNILKTDQNGKVTQVQVSVDDQTGAKTLGNAEVVTLAENTETGEDADAGKENLAGNSSGQSVLDQIVNGLNKAATDISQTQSTFQSAMTQQTGQTTDMQSIISQITDYMKVQLKPDMTSMELQLHPQSLGNVNVIVTAGKDGGVVAQFTAQNETVKAALESQVAQLQQRFDEQGIKIDSVEVTLQSHQFEQNLQQGSQQQADTQNTGKSTRGVHRINLGEMSSDGEEIEALDDDSRLTAQMMAVNGNTVDYTA